MSAMEAQCVCLLPSQTEDIAIEHARQLHERIRALEAVYAQLKHFIRKAGP